MKKTTALLPILFLTLDFQTSGLAQNTAFTYQGQLGAGGAAANGLYDLRFRLFVDPLGNTQTGSALLTNGVPISNGLFTVALDFGPGVFNGSNYWLELEVKTNGAAGYVALSPLQALTPTPYAIFAQSAGSSGFGGTYTNALTLNNGSNQFTGTFTGNGANLTNVNAATLGGRSPAGFWNTSGNGGTTPGTNFIGTSDNQALELRANSQRALRLEPDSSMNGAPNVIGGAQTNSVSAGVVGATIGGGGSTNYNGSAAPNTVTGNYGTVSGGVNNSAALEATVGGGSGNRAGTNDATVGGGIGNIASDVASTIGGGSNNLAFASFSSYATIGGGAQNTVARPLATIGGGFGNNAYGVESTVAGGWQNSVGGDNATVGGGYANTADLSYATVGGGFFNLASGVTASIGGGAQNHANADNTTVGGGSNNQALALGAVVSGGIRNTASGYAAVVGGGTSNTASGTNATVAGGANNLATGYGATVGGGAYNSATLDYATVAGGYTNTASGNGATVGGGGDNIASASYATVPGGLANTAAGVASFAAGFGAHALHDNSFVWSDGRSFSSSAPRQFAVSALGGVLLAADVQLAGGYHNLSLSGGNALGYLYGSYGFYGDGIHLGYNFYADAAGTPHVYNSGGGTSRLTAGYGFISLNVGPANTPPGTLRLQADVGGVTVYGTFNNQSDRNAKQDFAPVNPADILDKVTRLPVSEWSYKEDPTTRHLGPVAQDFYSIFNIGTDDRHIAPMDEGGVALAAIKGANQKLENRTQQLEAENADLRTRLEKLEQIVRGHEPD